MDKHKKRHLSRELAVQTVYMQFIDQETPWQDLLVTILETQKEPFSQVDKDFIRDLLSTLDSHQSLIKERLNTLMKNGLESVPMVEQAILMIAAAEMSQEPCLTSKSVIINEALVILRSLSDEKNVKFFNAVLDHYAQKFAPHLDLK